MSYLKISILSILTFSVLLFTACNDDDAIIVNGEEIITTLTYTLTPSGGGTATVLTFEDLDGDGGNAPTITGGTLSANTTYTGSLELLNESVSPVESITEEIKEEDEEHQFFFSTSIAGLSVQYTDTDPSGNPLGLSSTLSTTDAGTGTLTIILRHEPNKSATGVAGGDITNAGGETDIEVDFNIEVQ